MIEKLHNWSALVALESSPEYIVTSVDDLNRLSSWSWALLSHSRIRLALRSGPDTRRDIWEAQLNQENSRCGCIEGSLSFVICAAGIVVILLLQKCALLNEWWEPSFWRATFICFCAGIMGKIFGLLRKRLALASVTREIRVAALSSKPL